MGADFHFNPPPEPRQKTLSEQVADMERELRIAQQENQLRMQRVKDLTAEVKALRDVFKTLDFTPPQFEVPR